MQQKPLLMQLIIHQITNLTPSPSVNIQHPHIFEHLASLVSTCYQQQWVFLSRSTSNTTGSMVVPSRWSGTSSGVQFCPILKLRSTHMHMMSDVHTASHMRQIMTSDVVVVMLINWLFPKHRHPSLFIA